MAAELKFLIFLSAFGLICFIYLIIFYYNSNAKKMQTSNKIYGQTRRDLKKDLSELKRQERSFWYLHQMDKDMSKVHGGNKNYPMSDQEAQKRYNQLLLQIQHLKNLLEL